VWFWLPDGLLPQDCNNEQECVCGISKGWSCIVQSIDQATQLNRNQRQTIVVRGVPSGASGDDVGSLSVMMEGEEKPPPPPQLIFVSGFFEAFFGLSK
jgi:hypothetical protein